MKPHVRAWQRRAQSRGFKTPELRQSTPLQQWMSMRRVGRETASKVVINEDTALRIAAVFCSVRILSGLCSTLPADVYERKGPGLRDVKVHEHPASRFLSQQPNEWQVPAVFEEQRQAHLSLWGNSYTELFFGPEGVSGGRNHHPYNVEAFADDRDLNFAGKPKLKYRVFDETGTRILDRSSMAHVPGFGFDGFTGLSTLSLAGESFGIAASGDRLAATFNGNAAKPFLIVETPDYLDDGPYQRLSREIREEYAGDNAFGSMLLEGGATARNMSLPFKDAQFLESRKFQGEEISSRWFGLPPHLAGYLDQAHFDNVEEQDRALLVFTVAPMLIRKEQVWNRTLFDGRERDRFYVKYNVDALLRGQQKERYEAHRNAIQAGWKTVNEVRAAEDLPPLPGGDELPRPAAIWGKDDPAAAPRGDKPALPPPKEGREHDPRLLALAVEVISGLQAAERVHAERSAKHADAEQRLREWYEGHERRALDKLAPLGGPAGTILDHLREHRDQLVRACRDADRPAAVELCLAGWTNDPTGLAAKLLTLTT